ncbi:MAG: HAD-IIB family hydrolase [Planctomycetaceae bacterium]
MSKPVLATDLDGTLIPMGEYPENVTDLQELKTRLREQEATVIFVTGRFLESIQAAIGEFDLPVPDWIIADVGTSIYEHRGDLKYEPLSSYQDYQAEITEPFPIAKLREELAEIPGLLPQEEEKQGRFKLSYYAPADQLDALAAQTAKIVKQLAAPYSIIQSLDPHGEEGFLDFLPRSISKAHALNFWHEHVDRDPERTVFSGDSGNDLAALTAGYRSIVVGNAEAKLADKVQAAHTEAGWTDRLHLAERAATSGVLEGCHRFGMFG